ncbi:hypothetical protein QBC35DRAFT_295137 [Podospora australis]|uniref:NTF2 domain-containing protein n=1 Tax=Podospora australis TaxID=1536484 RepID=A0AAN7ANA9_9PEZI|nr:hypothetical protein QBC35DRAFT_295137 [Podospora australis]
MSRTDDTNARCCADAANKFVTWYYQQLNEGKPIAQAYVNKNETLMKVGHPPAEICINGQMVATPEDLDTLWAQQRSAPLATTDKTHVHYDVHCFDAVVINKDYRFACPQNLIDIHGPNDGVRMMMTVTVSGDVYFGVSKNWKTNDDFATKQHFNDVFILVPNWEVIGKQNGKFGKKYLVSSHTYRAF